jgi:aspartyl protease family protein
MNSADAKYAKIDYETTGRKIKVSTANGIATAYLLTVNTLKLGTITLHNVEVAVTEGGSPPFVLLGMSAQNRLNLKRENSILTITKKY